MKSAMAAKSENWHLLAQLVSSTEASLTKVLQAKHGIGLTEFLALNYLDSAENSELRMQDLAARLQLNQSSVTRLVERLERAGLTKRDVCANDKRGVYTVINESGRQALELAKPDYEAHISETLNSRDLQRVLISILK